MTLNLESALSGYNLLLPLSRHMVTNKSYSPGQVAQLVIALSPFAKVERLWV